MSRTTRTGWMLGLSFFTLISSQAYGILAQTETEAPAPQPSPGPLQEALGFWATAAFVWVILFLAMAFVIAMAWLSRSRRS